MRIAAKLGLFAGGVLFGTAGIRILSSRDAKKVYTHATAAVLRARSPLQSLPRPESCAAGEENPSRLRAGESYEVQNFT